MRGLRAWLVLTTFFVFTLPLMPLQLLFLRTGSRYARTFPNWYHRQVCRLVGVRLHIDGGVAREQGVLLISNHVSWLDITVLSAVAPVSFVAKQEVASWPFVSWLAKLQRSVFVDRTRRSEVTDKANEILRRLEAGDHVVLFAEGTSSDGNGVVPFKTPLFAAVKPTGGASAGDLCAQTLALDLHQAARPSALPPRAANGCLVRRHGPGKPCLASLGPWPARRAYPHRAAGAARRFRRPQGARALCRREGPQ